MPIFDFSYSKKLFVARSALGGITDILIKVKGLLFMPIYARILGPDNLGVYSITLAASVFIAMAISWNITNGFFYYTIPQTEKKQIGKNYSTTLNVVLLFGSVIGLFIIAAVLLLSYGWVGIVAAATFFSWTSVIRNVTIIMPQMFQHTKLLSAAILATEYGGAALALLFVLVGFGPLGLIVGMAFANLLAAGFLHRVVIKRDVGWERTINFEYVKKYLKLSLPLIPSSIAAQIAESMDKFMLLAFIGIGEVGIYQIGVSGASILSVIPSMVNFSYTATAARLWCTDRDKFRDLSRFVGSWVFGLGLLGIVFLALFGGFIAHFLGGQQYMAAAPIMPILGMAVWGSAFVVMLVPLFNLYKRTVVLMAVSIIAATIDIILNCVLIPIYGMFGAAVSTAICVWLTAASMYIVLRYYNKELPYAEGSL